MELPQPPAKRKRDDDENNPTPYKPIQLNFIPQIRKNVQNRSDQTGPRPLFDMSTVTAEDDFEFMTDAAKQAQRKAAEKVRIAEENLKKEQQLKKKAEEDLLHEVILRTDLEAKLDELGKKNQALQSSLETNATEIKRYEREAESRILELTETNREREIIINNGVTLVRDLSEELRLANEAHELLQIKLQEQSLKFEAERKKWEEEQSINLAQISQLQQQIIEQEQSTSERRQTQDQIIADLNARFAESERLREEALRMNNELQQQITGQEQRDFQHQQAQEVLNQAIIDLNARLDESERLRDEASRTIEELRAPPPPPPPLEFHDHGVAFPDDDDNEMAIAPNNPPQNINECEWQRRYGDKPNAKPCVGNVVEHYNFFHGQLRLCQRHTCSALREGCRTITRPVGRKCSACCRTNRGKRNIRAYDANRAGQRRNPVIEDEEGEEEEENEGEEDDENE